MAARRCDTGGAARREPVKGTTQKNANNGALAVATNFVGLLDGRPAVRKIGDYVSTGPGGGIIQPATPDAPSAPSAEGVLYFYDGTNVCIVMRTAAGVFTTNKLTMSPR